MGDSVSCCTQPPPQGKSLREIISLEDSVATKQWMDEFLKSYPKIEQIYARKPKYCYKISSDHLTEKEEVTVIGKIPEFGATNEVIVMYKDGYLYQGDVKDELIREGCGRMVSSDGDCYQGQWKGNQPDGPGTYEEYSPKRKMTGVWVGGHLSGKGRACYEDGSVYEGDFYQNCRHGKGKIQYADGSMYQGSFKNNLMEGFGTLIGINHKYEGSWKAGRMEGGGKSYWYNDDDELLETYEGEYENGVKHGKGEYRWANGRVFEGEWEYGQIKKRGSMDNIASPEAIRTN